MWHHCIGHGAIGRSHEWRVFDMGRHSLWALGLTASFMAAPVMAQDVVFWHAFAGQSDKVAFIDYALDAFATAHPEIKLEVVATEQSSYKTKLNTAMAAGTPPDVFYSLPGGFLGAFVSGGQVMALDDAMAKDGWGDSFLASALAQTTIDGHIYAAPVDIDSVVFWYDRALFAEKGWQTPSTWDELMALAAAAKEDGLIPFALGNKDAWPATFWFQYAEMRRRGSGQITAFVQGDAGATLMPEAEAAFGDVATVAEAGYFPIGFNGMGDQEANILFLNGQAAMMLNGTWQIGASADAPEGFELGFFGFPSIAGGAGDQSDVLGGVAATYAIAEAAKNKDAALTLVRFLTSPEVMEKYVDMRKTMVTVKGATTEAAAGPVLYGIASDLMAAAGSLDPFYDTAMPPVATSVYYNVLQGVLDGSVPPAEAAAKLEAALQAAE
jgi:raffinose/stachyose/melibiose transport system substrate-binding protein